MTIVGDGDNTTSSPRPLQVSGSAVSIAVQTVTGASSRKQMSQAYRRTGDMGDVAAEFFESKRKNSASHFFIVKDKNRSSSQQRLTVAAVHEMLQSIAMVPSGKGSQAARQNLLVKLLRSCREKDEVRFLVRTLLGNMRLGATIKTVLVALATATTEELDRCQSQKSGSDNIATERFTSIDNGNAEMVRTLERTFHICPRIPEIAHALLLGGVPYAAKHCTLSVGFPIQPMLANPASSFEQVRDFLKDSSTVDESEEQQQYLPAVLEWKYDGVRCQAHWDGNAIKLFSRHLLETTHQFPDVVKLLLEAKHNAVASFVVDAEIVAIVDSAKSEDGIRLLPFQDLSTRRSVTKQEAGDGIVRVCIFCFDLVYLNGRSLLEEPLWRRQELLHAHFNESAGFQFASSAPLPQYDESLIRNALASAVQGGAEGLMIKLTGEVAECTINNVSSSGSLPTVRTFGYESGMRGKLWLKLKRDYVAGYADTIDVVPIGAWYGSGRKAQRDFLSPVLLAIYDEEEGTFQSISRCMSFSDDMYNAMREFYFRGTPYPSSVGISSDQASDHAKLETKNADKNNSLDDQDAVPTSSNDSDGSEADKDDNVAVSERVNCLPSQPSLYVTNETPTIWFKPLEVFEVSFADLSLSRAHTAASNIIGADENRGIALRFPRFKRRRPDKLVEQATTAAQIADLFRQQSKVHK